MSIKTRKHNRADNELTLELSGRVYSWQYHLKPIVCQQCSTRIYRASDITSEATSLREKKERGNFHSSLFTLREEICSVKIMW